MKRRIIIASHNPHKVAEIKKITQGLNLEIVGLMEISDYPEIIEDGESLQENAAKKALEIAKYSGEYALADDTGLEVDALDGAPGIYSARFAGEPSDDVKNRQLLLKKLATSSNRNAQFRTVIALASPNGSLEYSEGIIRGEITKEERGTSGFGYDPVFLIPEHGLTFAELGDEIKNKISHRALALQGILKVLESISKNVEI